MANGHDVICTGSNAWKNIRRRFWRNEARQLGALQLWGEDNVKRMKKGLAPQKVAIVTPKSSYDPQERPLSCELHHIFGIKAEPTDCETVVMVWPHDHAAIDDDRVIDYVFLGWKE